MHALGIRSMTFHLSAGNPTQDATIMGSRNGHAAVYMWYTLNRKGYSGTVLAWYQRLPGVGHLPSFCIICPSYQSADWYSFVSITHVIRHDLLVNSFLCWSSYRSGAAIRLPILNVRPNPLSPHPPFSMLHLSYLSASRLRHGDITLPIVQAFARMCIVAYATPTFLRQCSSRKASGRFAVPFPFPHALWLVIFHNA